MSTEIPSEIFPRVITFNSLTEYCEDDARNLRPGMIVMILNSTYRVDLDNPWADKWNRWCKIRNIEYVDSSEIIFEAEYADGVVIKRRHTNTPTFGYPDSIIWLVKRGSSKSSMDTEAKIEAIIMEALQEQAESIRQTNLGSHESIANRAAKRIMKLDRSVG